MKPIFVDTGGWIALAVVRDQFHRPAASFYRKISKRNIPLLTTNYVLVETYTRIRYDDGHSKAVQLNFLIEEAIKTGRLRLEWVTPAIHQKAWKIFEDFSDQVFSFVDCTSFVVARNIGVVEVFGFDEHFKTMGFILKP
jgi:predicted nucleic acid-binding protein